MKLVRDLIPQIIEDDGNSCDYHTANLPELKEMLYKKMHEELNEFIEKPCLEEAADMYEVLKTICWLHNIGMPAVISSAVEKREKRGGFGEGIILEGVNRNEEMG